MREIALIKKTLGKNDKYYFYESLGVVESVEDVHWYRTDEAYFNFLIEKYKKDAVKTELNDRGEIIYMEYQIVSEPKVEDTISISEEEIKKNAKGCKLSIIFAAIFFIIVLIIILL